MYKQPSLSKISSKSLSKIKNKIELAFSKPANNENKTKNEQNVMPVRSKSTKSLSKYKSEVADNNIPFAIAYKTGLIQTDRKQPQSQSTNLPKGKQQRGVFISQQESENVGNFLMSCRNPIANECIVGFSWFHNKKKELISVCKKNQDKLLRYFAMKEQPQGKSSKKIIAALQDDILYTGSKDYMIIKSNNKGLINKDETMKLQIKQSDFIIILQTSVSAYCNLNRIVSDIYLLISDGLSNLDTITNIVGRRIVELSQKSSVKKLQQYKIPSKGVIFQTAYVKLMNRANDIY